MSNSVENAINERIKAGREKSELRREKQEEIIRQRKEGIAFAHDTRFPMLVECFDDHNFNPVVLVIGVSLEPEKRFLNMFDNRFRYAYAICSPNDTFSLKVAKGLVGYRLKNKTRFSDFVRARKDLSPKELLHLAYCSFNVKALNGDDNISERLIRASKNGIRYYNLEVQ